MTRTKKTKHFGNILVNESRKQSKKVLKDIIHNKVNNVEYEDKAEPIIYEDQVEIKESIDKDAIIDMINKSFDDKIKNYDSEKQRLKDEKQKIRLEEKAKKDLEKQRLKDEKLKIKEEEEKKKTAAQMEYYKQYITDTVYNKNKTEITNKIFDIQMMRRSIHSTGNRLNF